MRLARALAVVAVLATVVAVLSGGAPARVSVTSADLAVTNTASPSPVKVGAALTYTIGVRNNGPDPAMATRVADALPMGFTFVSVATSVGSCTGGMVVRCTLGTMASGATATVTVHVTPTIAGQYPDTATVSSATPDPAAANNSARASVISYIAVIDFAYDPAVTTTRLGQTVTWKVTGNAPHTVTDDTGLNLYDSGVVPHNQFFHFAYPGAGTYLYLCTIHFFTGKIGIPPNVAPRTGPLGSHFTIRWAMAAPPAGDVFDLQVKVPGGMFVPWLTGQTGTAAMYTPASGPGNYMFRARLRNPSTGKMTTYSPPAVIGVT